MILHDDGKVTCQTCTVTFKNAIDYRTHTCR